MRRVYFACTFLGVIGVWSGVTTSDPGLVGLSAALIFTSGIGLLITPEQP